ncbi:MAG: transposon-encoded TnpW family protein [Eubacteriales bacterium]
MTEQTAKSVPNSSPQGTFTHKIGGITYNINVHFNENTSETIDDKIKRMVLDDCDNYKNSLLSD